MSSGVQGSLIIKINPQLVAGFRVKGLLKFNKPPCCVEIVGDCCQGRRVKNVSITSSNFKKHSKDMLVKTVLAKIWGHYVLATLLREV